jgi:uncharacterized membrane protein YjjB (DUF3815 family)
MRPMPVHLKETTMKVVLFALAVAGAAIAIGTPAQAQNYPWCVYIAGTGGARNCGFVSFAQCQQSALGLGTCQRNVGYDPHQPMR